MNRFCWRLADLASRLLERNERDAVCGDLQEAGTDGARALRDVAGLVCRRQLLAWTNWRQWIALVTLIVPLGILLSVFARSWAYTNAIYAWLYVDNWTPAYLASPGSRADLFGRGAQFLAGLLAAAGWSWTSGFVLASISRRAIWTSGALFCLVVFAEFGTASRVIDQHQAVFSLTFYRSVFPRAVQTLSVLVPSMWGMWIGYRGAPLAPRRAIVLAFGLAAMSVFMMRGLEMSAAAWLETPPMQPRSMWLHLVPAATWWPAGYILFTARKARTCDAS